MTDRTHLAATLSDAAPRDAAPGDVVAGDTTAWDAAEPRRYVAYVRGADRPGTLTAVAEVVSSRGVSMESFTTSEVLGGTTLMTAVFQASERLQRLIERTLGRLAAVSEVLILPAEDFRVLAAGVVHTVPGRFVPPSGVSVTWAGDASPGQPLLVEGTLLEVERVLDAARSAGAQRVSFVLLPL